jgi:threonine/homoserine/homoserine lactone efflux protein
MSGPAALLGFAAVAGVLTIIPGLDTALVLRTALIQGRRRAFATALGIVSGALVWGAGAAVGVSALLTASKIGYSIVKIAGAAYMVWLGYRFLRSAMSHRADDDEFQSTRVGGSTSAWRCWQRGLLTNLLNPKIGAFYVAVLPQFIPAHAPHLMFGLLLTVVHDVEGMIWFAGLIYGAYSVRRLLSRRSTRRAMDASTGGVLIWFGVKLGLSAR